MNTPSLRRRMTVAGVIVLAIVLILIDAFVYGSFRQRLLEDLHDDVENRAELVRSLSQDLSGRSLAQRLSVLGTEAYVEDPDGRTLHTLPAAGAVEELAGDAHHHELVPEQTLSREVRLDDGSTAIVYISRAAADEDLQRLLLILVAATLGALLLAAVLLRRAADIALRPLDTVVGTARAIADGEWEHRLHPQRTDTELGRMAVAFDEMLDGLETAVQTAQNSDERSRKFLVDAAHQLRTPIAGIRAAVELLLWEDDPQERETLQSHLLRESTRVSRLITALLRMARHDRGRPVDLKPVLLHELVAHEVERTEGLAPDLEVNLDTEHATDLPILADVDEVREAVANILDNARRHAETRIDVTVARHAHMAEIRIHDDGPGVAPEAENLIFERFATLDGKGGSGLGLPIARAIARAHGGDLVYHQGDFIFRIAVDPPPTEHEPTPADDSATHLPLDREDAPTTS